MKKAIVLLLAVVLVKSICLSGNPFNPYDYGNDGAYGNCFNNMQNNGIYRQACPICYDLKHITCQSCNGTGIGYVCGLCNGSGIEYNEVIGKWGQCYSCGGSRGYVCNSCGGTGLRNCYRCK